MNAQNPLWSGGLYVMKMSCQTIGVPARPRLGKNPRTSSTGSDYLKAYLDPHVDMIAQFADGTFARLDKYRSR